MAELLIFEFDAGGEDDYVKVNGQLGVDPLTGDGEWPAGLISHAAAVKDDGAGLCVVEVWESRQAQAEFMQTRLGPALAGSGIEATPRVTWRRVVGHNTPG